MNPTQSPIKLREFTTSLTLGVLIFLASSVVLTAADATYHSFSNSNAVSRINGNGKAKYTFPLPSLGSFTQPTGIAVDPVAKKLYYTRINFIASINLDGTGNVVVKDFGANNSPTHLEIDVENGHLYTYFNGHTKGSIPRGTYRMKTDGTELTPIMTEIIIAGMTPPPSTLVKSNGRDGLVIDTVGNKLYWSDARILYSSTLTGTDAEIISLFPYSISGFDINHASGKLYYSNSTTIDSSNLDGTSAATVYSPGFGFPEAIEVDAAKERIYFIHNIWLKYTNLDGSLAPVEVNKVGNTRGKDIEVGPMPDLTAPTVKIAAVKVNGAPRLKVSYSTDPGIQYTLQSSGDLTAGSWVDASATVAGTGGELFAHFTYSGKRKFFRAFRHDPCK